MHPQNSAITARPQRNWSTPWHDPILKGIAVPSTQHTPHTPTHSWGPTLRMRTEPLMHAL